MTIRRILILLAILLLLPFGLKLRSQDFGQSQSLYTDKKAYQVGDLLTVFISEQAKATNQVENKTEKSTKAKTEGGPGIGKLKFIGAFGVDGTNQNTFNGKGENTRQGVLVAKMSVTVIGKKDNGDLIVEGQRIVAISGDRETMTLTGVVRTKDIASDNSVQSYQIADADIRYTGKGNSNTASRPGFITRLLNWIF
jgi:flagellar L-ring protein precursor FlgH